MSRYYLFPEGEDPLRLSQRLVEGLTFGTDALPQFAGTKQRVLSAMLEHDEGKPVRIIRTEAAVWQFDKDGGIREGLHQALALAMDSLPTPQPNATVVQLHPHAKQAKLQKEYRWEPGGAEIERVIADIWPKRTGDRLKSAKGTTTRKPPLTFDARHAIDEISGQFWKISNAIEQLKEPSQKSFGFEARERSRADPEYAHLYRAIAEMSDWHLEVQRRRRTGKGVWYAVVDVTLWDDNRVGESVDQFQEKCVGREAAVKAARKLLREHADRFADNITVEAEVLTDLEWDVRMKQLQAD
ncbi:hypothetical protein [Mesorhizobium sp. 131-2-1]|uniref:hypothetical protein n=1 Tax=Mesorhizobium sp. 131-2-1 TaxID=2744518 RepID=UPI0019269F27|nr:hypothetical protein [Mesorhizobium sp. 131-2-1]BCG91441.1 hypothetical protein MesoLj131a_03050 [Mesorhizobium sp. 131-2-1]